MFIDRRKFLKLIPGVVVLGSAYPKDATWFRHWPWSKERVRGRQNPLFTGELGKWQDLQITINTVRTMTPWEVVHGFTSPGRKGFS